jgi:hypothetical protein
MDKREPIQALLKLVLPLGVPAESEILSSVLSTKYYPGPMLLNFNQGILKVSLYH